MIIFGWHHYFWTHPCIFLCAFDSISTLHSSKRGSFQKNTRHCMPSALCPNSASHGEGQPQNDCEASGGDKWDEHDASLRLTDALLFYNCGKPWQPEMKTSEIVLSGSKWQLAFMEICCGQALGVDHCNSCAAACSHQAHRPERLQCW